jgi:hypothetical protein
VEDGEVTSVAYEPVQWSRRWVDWQILADRMRRWRAVAAIGSRDGRFALDGIQASELGDQLRGYKSLDPALAIYAAYAYAAVGRDDLVREMSRILTRRTGWPLFDLELLGRQLIGQRIDRDTPILSFMPLLAQGWALLRAHDIQLPSVLDGIERTLLPSLWTLVDHRGVELVERALHTEELR